MTTELHDTVAARLGRAGQRYTDGRRRLVAALARAGGPATSPQIMATDPSLAQSSIYRNLTVLEEAGVVARLVTGNEFASYELAQDLTDHHHHLVCTGCGTVTDFTLDASVEAELDRVLARHARKMRYEVDHHRLDLVGRCATCR